MGGFVVGDAFGATFFFTAVFGAGSDASAGSAFGSDLGATIAAGMALDGPAFGLLALGSGPVVDRPDRIVATVPMGISAAGGTLRFAHPAASIIHNMAAKRSASQPRPSASSIRP